MKKLFKKMRQRRAYMHKGVISGWTIDAEAIFTGTKSTEGGFATVEGFTLGSDGSIHTPNFYLNMDGTVGLRSSTTGKRIEINSVNNRIDLFNEGNSNIIRIDDTIDGSLYPGIAIRNPGDLADKLLLDYSGITGYINGTQTLRISIHDGITLGMGLRTGGANLKAVYFSLDDGKFYRAT